MLSSDESIVVIGGGFGGLSTACYLADAGADVTLVEKNDQLGGRASVLERDGFRFDMGPSWYMMPDAFERFFGDFGRKPEDFYGLEQLDPNYRIFFKDGDRVDISPDLDDLKRTFESYETGAGETLEAYLDQAEQNSDILMEHFIYEDRTRLRDWLDPSLVRHLWGLSPLTGSMQDLVDDHFDHHKLKKIIHNSTLVMGGTPENLPGLYSLMNHVDLNLGVYYPEGGIGGVVDGMVELGESLGVEYVTDAPATAIRGRRGAFTVETGSGAFEADVVVSNADYAHTEQELLPPENRGFDADYWEDRTYTPSCYLLYLGVEGDIDELAHHTYVLPDDWDRHFEQVFHDAAWPEDPIYYVCVPSKTDDTVAPDGHSALFLLSGIAPGLDDSPEHRETYRNRLLDDLAENTGCDVRDRIVFEEQFAVSDFVDRYNSMFGTAFGLAHTLDQTPPLRPPHRSKALDGLYFTGHYTAPGLGVPMCVISGKVCAEKVVADAPGA